ncbi:hypothetical protein FHS43_000543 [Streptosporangium becharense]|uniref:Uncharacterized protein n=1 Tax=Streptosporangium becharense TaxID=1816182 RepID=A0A7W9IN50_9ACTN|nr:hypothetical protein [Streptosporangium becharense]MBB2909297.1 hypothetical protein [Streptosporangium becharense]MBB5823800.1 hypothetical protein [Streptosporangium becharense]
MATRILEVSTITGTFVLAHAHGDPVDALTRAATLSTAALGLLFRYLACPPAPGIGRAELAAGYGLTVGQLRRDHAELAEAGHLMQARRSLGRGRWQHLIVVTDTPGTLPAEHAAWALLDAALAAGRVNTSAESAHVPTCGDAAESQVATSQRNGHIEPVNPFASSSPEHKPSVVATVAELRNLARLPPLPAPTEQGDLWLTPAQVLTLAEQYPPRHGDMALGVLARAGLPFYLAPRVLSLLMQGYDTAQLSRTLAGVHDGDHPAAIARWRLDRLLLTSEPNRVAAAWRPPSTTIADPAPAPADPAAPATAQEIAATRARLAEIRSKMRARR